MATPENPETEPSFLDTQENVSSLPTIYDLTHLTSTVNTNLYPILSLTIPEGYGLVEFKSAENALDVKTIQDNIELFPDEPWSTTPNVEFSLEKELKIEENIRVVIACDFTKIYL